MNGSEQTKEAASLISASPLMGSNCTSDNQRTKSKEEIMADLYAASGGFGLFQVYAFFVFQCAISNIAFWWNSLGFYI